jgi:hypothetical protein
MAAQYSIPVRNARLDAIETAIGAGAIMKIRSGAAPANCAAADAGAVLATLNLPADWMTNAAAGVKGKSGSWGDASADNAGTAAHFRIYAADGVTCHMQGTVGLAGSGADLIVDNATFAAGQGFTVTQFDIAAGNA